MPLRSLPARSRRRPGGYRAPVTPVEDGHRDDRRAHRRRGSALVAAVATVLALLSACTGGGPDPTATPEGTGGSGPTAGQASGSSTGDLALRTLSSRPEFVTGGDTLLEVALPADVESDRSLAPILSVDGVERPGALGAPGDDDPRVYAGLVDGLPDGPSTLSVRWGDRSGSLEVVNHPATGPVFSGPRQEPFVCTTEELGLGAPLDEECSIEPQQVWHYRDASGAWRPLPEDRSVPADAQVVETGSGPMPFVVRTEARTIDRGVAWVSVLDREPTSEQWSTGEFPGWWGPGSSGWNGDLVYRFGGGCGTTYSQGAPLVLSGPGLPPTLDDALLSRGYAVATNTLNTFQVHCNDVLSAEAASMTKEHFVERYGTPRHTIGEGGSGGAIQQFLVAQNYPGILDASVIGAPFPDAMSMAPGVTDCGLLDAYYRGPEGSTLTAEQRRAINGHATDETCRSWVQTFLQVVDPTVGCELPEELIYDPQTRPDGARCTLQDSSVNLFGTDPATGFARRPLDNTGVVYGLEAFRAGVIDGEQFTALNEGVGSYDIDGRIQPGRSRGATEDLEHLARTGRVLQGAGDATRIPVVAVNTYGDPTGDIHDRWRIFSVRDRYERAVGGEATGLAVWTVPGGNLVGSAFGGDASERDRALDAVAGWLEALDRDGSSTADDDRLEALARTRPDEAADRCVLPDGTEVAGPDVYDDGTPCAEAYPLAGDPRRAAGQPIDALTARCELQPIESLDVVDRLEPAQLERLRAVFPDGVCDWSRPGVGTVPVEGVWRSYGS